MIKIENVDTYGWDAAIRGMRNPMNSWDKSDSYWGLWEDESPINPSDEPYFFVGEADLTLMRSLVRAGSDHRKFLRQVFVSMDITAPLYWWKEFDTYKVGTVANSCSTMHKIHDRDLTLGDFSCEHLDAWGLVTLGNTIRTLNLDRDMYVHYDDKNGMKTDRKEYWYQMIQLLPSSYNQRRTVTMNYEVLLNMYHARKDHKLDEWRIFCETIVDMPYFREVCIDE
jgi:hypothetical protein